MAAAEFGCLYTVCRFAVWLESRDAANLDQRPIRTTVELARNQCGDFARIPGRILSNGVSQGALGVARTPQVFLRQGELH